MYLIAIIKKIQKSLSDNYENRQWTKFILKVVGLLLMLACMVTAIAMLVWLIIENLQAITVTVGVICFLIWLVLGILPKRHQEPENPSNYLQYDPITLENTYKLIRSGICTIIGEVGEIVKVRKPASYSQMDAPTHYDIVAGVPIYHLLVPKLGEAVDTYVALGILQNAIEQKLNGHALPGINQAVFFYNGQAYPALMVDMVHDLGNFIQIDVAVASESYCRYREQRLYNSINPSSGQNPQDRDF